MSAPLYWEIAADQIASDGWSYGYIRCRMRDFEGWTVDAHKGCVRHMVEAEDLNVAFLEVQRSIREASKNAPEL